jgi:hypothetical protein
MVENVLKIFCDINVCTTVVVFYRLYQNPGVGSKYINCIAEHISNLHRTYRESQHECGHILQWPLTLEHSFVFCISYIIYFIRHRWKCFTVTMQFMLFDTLLCIFCNIFFTCDMFPVTIILTGIILF